MKVVLDTNVLLAAFATRGLCEALMMACLTKHEIMLSEFIIEEFQRHLTGKFKLSATLARERVKFLRDHVQIVEPVSVSEKACRDPKDLAVLGTAIAAKADFIVTGDDDLLCLGKFEGIVISKPRDFYQRFG